MRFAVAIAVPLFVAVSLACGSAEDEVASTPSTPEPTAAPAPSGGFAHLYDDQRTAPRPRPSGDTAAPSDPAPAAAPDPTAPEPATPAPADAEPVAPSPTTTAPEPTAPAPADEPEAVGYRAVVAFYTTRGTPPPADWTSTVTSLTTAMEAHGIRVIVAPEGADSVAVGGGTVNIAAFRAARDAGFVFAAAGRQAVFTHYPPQTSVEAAARSYFSL